MVTVSVDARDLARLTERLNSLSSGLQGRVITRSLNYAAGVSRTEASRRIRAEVPNLKASTVRDRLIVRRATAGNASAELDVSYKAIPLIEYVVGSKQPTVTRKRSRALTVSVKKGRKTIAHAFIARMRSGHVGVFIRESGAQFVGRFSPGGKGFRRRTGGLPGGIRVGPQSGLVGRLPIRELFGPAVLDVFRRHVDSVADFGIEKLGAELERQVDLALSGQSSGGGGS